MGQLAEPGVATFVLTLVLERARLLVRLFVVIVLVLEIVPARVLIVVLRPLVPMVARPVVLAPVKEQRAEVVALAGAIAQTARALVRTLAEKSAGLQ